jgi:TRAP-type C4-dicarboxylate transport system substrate-binding protein
MVKRIDAKTIELSSQEEICENFLSYNRNSAIVPVRLLRSFAIVISCIAASLFACNAFAHGVTLKVQHFLPANSLLHTQVLQPWQQKMETESNGYLRMQLYPAMQMGGAAAQLYDQVKERTVDIVLMAASLNSGRFPSLEVFNLPLGRQTAQGSSRALWEYIEANNLARLELKGMRLLAAFVSAPGAIESSATVPEIYLLVMNSATYKSLSDELKAVISANSGAETSALFGKIIDNGTRDQAPMARDEASQQRAQSAVDTSIKNLELNGLNGKELVESARALIHEYDPAK